MSGLATLLAELDGMRRGQARHLIHARLTTACARPRRTTMLSLLERNIRSIASPLVILAPPHVQRTSGFVRVIEDAERRQELVAQMQRLRGGVYLSDGALRPEQLGPEGRHQTPEDDRSWHLLMLNDSEQVSSCLWYMEHDPFVAFDRLRVRSCPLASRVDWREHLTGAVGDELDRARRDGLRYAEIGGWAVAPHSRCTSEGLLLALATYALGRFFGGALGLTTATLRHGSSSILRRLGGAPLERGGVCVPTYYDPRYDCEMELLRFDSRRTNPRYDGLIELLRSKLSGVQVYTAVSTRSTLERPARTRQVA